ncbi:inosine triphosphate pyrophosphatase [Piptocephalis cylindrospora]|uniref:Inosine triphosphate pyrophosphatase n=1 Tax=Piptocephalis cylindrospora TaxID=1907219 RepID=A0A4P9Y9Y0_9FUNG|nr:inosine triphosphate pyrophosphatase [Piptocephalis cylindrospora]|eukprot:RKP15261.1 inosine triphosphate pyrophosphatase [Piptocephalis cylindrospora]
MPALRTLTFVTGNAKKLEEVCSILQGVVNVVSHTVDLTEIQGTAEEVAKDKCRRAAEALNGPCIVEDTGLIFNAMGHLPGPYIKWFMESLGHDGLNRMLVGFGDKSATATCTFALSNGPGTEPIIFEGRTLGEIVQARGPKVFGWDAVFQPQGHDQTYAEMPKELKNTLSHRSKALALLLQYLKDEDNMAH